MKLYLIAGGLILATLLGLGWRIDYLTTKVENLEVKLSDKKADIKKLNLEAIEAAKANASNLEAIEAYQKANHKLASREAQTKQQFEQANKTQQATINDIRSKYDEARKRSTDDTIIRNDTIELRNSACRYCGRDPFKRSESSDNVQD